MSETYYQRFGVPFEYPVYFTEAAFSPTNLCLVQAISRQEPNRRHRVLAVVDSGVERAQPRLMESITRYTTVHAGSLELGAPPLVLAGGENAKSSMESVEKVYQAMASARLDRRSVVMIIGGGAVQDCAGYAAATLHRGVRVVRLPTTVEGQNDSGVGVKTALNAYGNKNYIGTFSPPFAVVNDISFIDTLHERDKRSGIAEAVKVALLRDASYFEWLWHNCDALASFERSAMATMIRRSAELHMQHIAECGDPFEMGAAKPLDFGHWSAHKLELLSDYGVRHGEAVAVGLAIDARYSADSGMIDQEDVARICVLLERLGFVLWHRSLAERDGDGRRVVMYGLEEFREHLGGELTLTMLTAIGNSCDIVDIDIERMARAVDWLEYRSRAG